MFPSNIPVYGTGSQPLSTSQSSSFLNTIMEAKEQDSQHSYQNGVTLQPIKLNERSNIIYGKLTKSHSSSGCSSFKPKQVACPQVGSIEVQAEVYQNVGSTSEEAASEGNGKEKAGSPVEAPNYMNC